MPLKELCALSLGQWATVRTVRTDCPISGRLKQLGFENGTRVCRVYSDRAGFISAYRVDNATISLRKPDAAAVLVEL